MRHRICTDNGLGNCGHVILKNQGPLNEKFADELLDTYFCREGGFDYQVEETFVKVGLEPTYQYDPLKILTICENKRESSIMTGRAFGAYGSQVVSKTKKYVDYKRNCKFTKFVDKWHPILFGEMQDEKN